MTEELKQPAEVKDEKERNNPADEALLKAEDKIKSLVFKDEPATETFRDNLKNRILVWRHRRFSMSELLNKVVKGLVLMFNPKIFVPAVALFLIIAVGLSLTAPWLPQHLAVKSQWGKFSDLIISPAYAQDNFTAEATVSDSLGVGADTAFIVKSKDVINEQTLHDSIALEPATDFTLEKVDDHTYKVIPKQPLEGKKVYNLKITSAYVDQSGATAERDYSWAFQVKDIFKVLSSIPGNQANGVPLDAGIEITFSHENFTNYEKAFKIEPAVEGSFEIHKRTLVFLPKKLEAGTIYKVTIDKDVLQVSGSDSKLAENYVIQFETDPAGKKRGEYSEFSFQSNFNEIYTDREPALAVNLYNIKQEVFTVDVYAFSSADDFIAALEKAQKIPYWAQFNRVTYNTDISSLHKVSSFGIPLSPYGYNNYLVFPNKLSKGLYVVQVDINGVKIQTFMEVSDLTDYTSVTQTNTLVWLNNIKTKQPVAGAKIEVVGTDKQTVTGSDGTAVLPTSWLPGSMADKKYLLVDAGEKTIIPIDMVSNNPYPIYDSTISSSGAVNDFWYYFYTDRMTYQIGDTVSYWGFVKPREGVKGDSKVTIKLFGWQNYYDYYSDPVPLLETEAPLDANFTFTGNFSLGRLSAGYYYLKYYIGDEEIGSRYITIETYKKPAYKLEADAAKQAVFAGDEQSITVKANFFEGTPVPNLALQSSNQGDQLKTDSQGEFKKTFSTNAVSGDYGGTCEYFYPVGSEEANISASACYTVFNYNVVPKGDLEKSGDQEKLQLTVKKVDIAKANVEGATEDQYLHEVAPGLPVSVSITEISYQASETGQYYDFINKVVRKTYNYNEVKNNIGTASGVTDASGQYQYSFPGKKDRGYQVDVTIKDGNQEIHESYFAYYSPYDYNNQNNSYNLRYKDQSKTAFSIGENVALQYEKNGNLLPNGAGHFLYYRLFKGLVDYQISSNSEYDFNFEEIFLPGVYAEAVYFDGETYHRPGNGIGWPGASASLYIPFKQSDRELKVEVTPDKEKYQPGSQVNLAVNVTDKNGKAVAAAVNINLVDEAYYAIYPESADALGGLYNNRVDDGELVAYVSNLAPSAGTLGAERGGCFLGGTKITMADRTLKNIEDIKVGDQVLTFTNETGKEFSQEKVTKTFVHEVNEYLVINDKLKITPIHRVLLNGQWQMIGVAKVGDWLMDENGAKVEIKKIEDKRGLFKVYNLTVEPYHTFFAEGIYVHNDKGGGGVRSLFVDTAVFTNANTGADGKATVSFKLPDNITSWRVTTQALTGNLYAGDKIVDLKSSLPVFVNTTFAKEYLAADKPAVKARAFGDALHDGDKVDFKMDAPTLNLSVSEQGQAYQASYFQIPQLSLGEHAITTSIKADGYQDAVLEKINVLDTRFKETKTKFYDLSADLKPEGSSDGMTNLIFSDKNQGRFYNQLAYCYYCSDGDRVDQKLFRVASADLLKQYFGEKDDNAESFDGSMYQADDGGIALLPYASSDFELSAKAAFVAGDYFDKPRLTNYFYKLLVADDSTREQVGISLFALSGLGEPVLAQAENFASLPDLTYKEKLYIAIALNHLGDSETARNIYSAVMKEKGEKFDPYLRVKVSDNEDDILSLTSLAAILAGGLGMPEHEQLWNYVEDNYSRYILIDLEKLIYVSETLPKLTPGNVSFTINLPGQKVDKTLSKGDSFRLAVTPENLAAISFSNIKGQVGLVSSYQAPESNIAPRDNSYVSLRRAYYVNGVQTNTFKENDLVEIRMYPSFQGAAPDTGYQITDFIPSGLAVMTDLYSRGMSYSCTDYYPYDVAGQTVKFYIWRNWNNYNGCNSDFFSYYARVVNPGEYKAESAVIQSSSASEIKNYTGSAMVSIEK